MKHYLSNENVITYGSAIMVTILVVSHFANAEDTAQYIRRPFRCSRPSGYVSSYINTDPTSISGIPTQQAIFSQESTPGLPETSDEFALIQSSTSSVQTVSPNHSVQSLTPRCPPNMVYMNCTPTCNNSCQKPSGMIGCNNNCTESGGCVCPEGFLWKGNNCVTFEECGCFVSTYIAVLIENEVYVTDNCTERCICNSTGQFTCDHDYRCDGNATCDVKEGKRQCYCNDGLFGDGITCTIPIDCHQTLLAGQIQDGVYTIHPLNWIGSPFQVYCNMAIDEGGWTVIQRRVNGSIDFYRDWDEYKHGFGVLDHEFWLGNEKLFYLTNQKDYELRIDMVNSYGSPYYAHYTLFRVSNEAMNYKLSALENYSGTAGSEAMDYHIDMSFSTYDHDRDINSASNCAVFRTGAWWYRACLRCNLNGDYHGLERKGIWWYNLPGNEYNIKYIDMKIRYLKVAV